MTKSELNRFKLLVHLSGFKTPTEVKLNQLREEYKIGSISVFIEVVYKLGLINKIKEDNKIFIRWIEESSPDGKLSKDIFNLEKEVLRDKYPYLYGKGKKKERELLKALKKIEEIKEEGNNIVSSAKLNIPPAPFAIFGGEKYRKSIAPQLALPLDDLSSEEQISREALQSLKTRLLWEITLISSNFQKQLKELVKEIGKISLLFIVSAFILSSCGSKEVKEAGYIDPLDTIKVKFTSLEEAPEASLNKAAEFKSIVIGEVDTDILSGEQKAEVFALRFRYIAQQEEREYNIPACITLAQGILESSSGYSELCEETGNYFGVKCFDKLCLQGFNKSHCKKYCDDSCSDRFKKYESIYASFRDHSLRLQNSRYDPLKKAKNYKEYAEGLQSCGYATSKTYAKKLIRIIEKYQLYEYDLKSEYRRHNIKNK